MLALDASADAVARITANAARNGLANVTAREGNVFDELRYFERDGERFDTIVLDPPAFAKNKASVEKALSGYKDINLRALRLLSPGGVLVTCSCSYNVDEPSVSPGAGRGRRRRACARHGAREAHAGARPSGAADRAGDVLLEVRDSPERLGFGVTITMTRRHDDTMNALPLGTQHWAPSTAPSTRRLALGTSRISMGLDTRCSATFNKQTSVGRVQLETDYVLFRGDFRVKLALAAITGVTTKDGVLSR